MLKVFPKEIGVVRGNREYSIREADAGGGKKYNLAVLRQIEQGNGEAQEAARDLIDDFNPSLVLVVGIAGGLPSSDLTLGDVVLSSRIQDFSVEARKINDSTAYSIAGGPMSRRITNGLANLTSRKEMTSWHKGLGPRPRVSAKSVQVYGKKTWKNKVLDSIKTHFGRKSKRKQPTFVTGQIASSDRLVKDPVVLEPLLQSARHVLAIEMESGGVFRAARERCAMLAIRGISDIVGLNRSEEWTKYACDSAAAIAKAYLTTQPVEPKVKTEGKEEGGSERDQLKDSLFLNLVEISRIPETLYVAPATVPTMKTAWFKLLDKKRKGSKPIPDAWTLQSKNIYSFFDPIGTPLEKIIDSSAVEEHSTEDFFAGDDLDRRHLLSQLLRRALQQDLEKFGVRFFADDYVFSFLGWPGEPDRKFRYQNVHQQSEITVVTHRKLTPKKETKKKSKATKGKPKQLSAELIRHLSFESRFMQIGKTWYVEITPTYRFTYDGKRKSILHERSLKKIKRIERNRAVLSQVLLFTDLLCNLDERTGEKTLLGFNRVPPFVWSVTDPLVEAARRPSPSRGVTARNPVEVEV